MTPTLADDCETVLRLLADTPKGSPGLSLDAISVKTGWSNYTVNATLCALRGQITHTETRNRGKNIIEYRIKNP